MTRLSTLHPYPAMIADDLAVALSSKFIKPGMRVLDPFCGTGRTLLAAAEQGATCVGIDINPLAVIVTRAKIANISLVRLERLSLEMTCGTLRGVAGAQLDLEPGRKVKWFSRRSKEELCEIIGWLKTKPLRKDDRLLLAAILSATAREASYCRQDQWKLHRIQARKRSTLKRSPWAIFARRCKSAVEELAKLPNLRGTCSVLQGDALDLQRVLTSSDNFTDFDLVITSPPYGDSHTTVGYGGISGICLGVIQHLELRGISFENRCSIDRLCLGGTLNDSAELDFSPYSPYWHGGSKNPARNRVYRFLFDIEKSCEQIAKALRPGGRVILVVARRTVSGYRVYLDLFLESIMLKFGFVLQESYSRAIARKNTPFLVDRSGRKLSKNSAKNRVVTMRTEYVLVFRHAARFEDEHERSISHSIEGMSGLRVMKNSSANPSKKRKRGR